VITYPKGSHAVAWNEWRYIHYNDGSEELYNHKTDPNEWNNIANVAKNKKIKKQLADYVPKTKN
jgi:hypothetical protein